MQFIFARVVAMSKDIDAREFMRLFADVYQHFYRRVDAGDYRIRPESLAVLQHLHQSGPLTVTEAAAHFSRSQSAMSEIVDRLENRGLVMRIADERDRRRHLVWLSPDGRQMLSEAEEVLSVSRLARAMNQMNDGDRASLLKGMQALLDAAGKEDLS
jgi:DNA-binding MarR family transcriptional regulator